MTGHTYYRYINLYGNTKFAKMAEILDIIQLQRAVVTLIKRERISPREAAQRIGYQFGLAA